MANTSENLIQIVQGLFQDRANDPSQLPAALRFAPFNKALGNLMYQVLSTDLRLDTSDPRMGTAIADNADYADGSISYATVSRATQRYASQGFSISDATMEAMQDQNSFLNLANDAMSFVSSQLFDQWTLDFVTKATDATTGLVAGAALDVSVATTDLVAYFNNEIENIHRTSGKRPTHILMGQECANAMVNMDTIQEGPGVAIGSSAASTRRLGWASDAQLADFFRSKYGIELLVEDRTYLNAGTPAYVLSTDLFIGRVDARGGAVTSFMRNPSIVDFSTRALAYPRVEGIAIVGDSHWLNEVTDRQAGRRVTVTLP
jgi:hypothetical protein